MRDMHSILLRNARDYDGAIALSDGASSLTRAGLSARVAGFAAALREVPDTLGLFGENTSDWVVAQLAGWMAGKILVPIPTFFSPQQQRHILADCGLTHVIATGQWIEQARELGVTPIPVTDARRSELPEFRAGGGQIIYTSGSTGSPKGVRLALGQIEHSAFMLGEAIRAGKSDIYLSVLPLPLLLETVCAVCVPLIAGARTQFDPALTASIARGQPQGLGASFERHRPTTSVLVPELIGAWLGELAATGATAPSSLRFVAVGGAPVSASLAQRAWHSGIPVHEGYGLSECCSVVSVNRPGRRRAGTVGEPLPGLSVRIDDGEIIVDGPTVMSGYQNRGEATRPWRTGDLGELDSDGYLRIAGRKDNLIVTSYGRNVSPEWIEALLTADDKIAAAAVIGHGAPHLKALVVPSIGGAAWFRHQSKAQILLALAYLCREAPPYAVPRDFVVVGREEALRRGLLTSNGRFRRALIPAAYADIHADQSRIPQREEMTA